MIVKVGFFDIKGFIYVFFLFVIFGMVGFLNLVIRVGDFVVCSVLFFIDYWFLVYKYLIF